MCCDSQRGNENARLAMATQPILLFDLGGVLVKGNGRRALAQLVPLMTEAQMLERLTHSRALGLFERGRLSKEAFAAAFMAEWDIAIPESIFLDSFATWIEGYFDGAITLVQTLRSRYRIGCLSNTNAVHWHRLNEMTRLFDFTFASHLTGFAKPEHAAYEIVLRTLDVPATHIYFFDDLRLNVEAARKLGINAFLVHGPEEIWSTIEANNGFDG